jgi:hypothetical protein
MALFSDLENDPRIYEMMWEVEPAHKFHVKGEECLGYVSAKGKDMKEAIAIYLEMTDRKVGVRAFHCRFGY